MNLNSRSKNMACQINWNFKDYKTIEQDGEGIRIVTAITPVQLTGLNNNALEDMKGILVVSKNVLKGEENSEIEESYDISFRVDNKVVGSLYVITSYEQKSDGFQTILKNVFGTLSCKGLFSEFNNGTAVIEYDNDSGNRCLTLLPK